MSNFYDMPSNMKHAMDRYLREHIPTGDFLKAVICNDLRGACEAADDINITKLHTFIAYLYWEAPSRSWGSKENYEAWINFKCPSEISADPY